MRARATCKPQRMTLGATDANKALMLKDATLPKELPPQFRSFEITEESVDSEKRTVSLSFSSEAEIERLYGIEVLDHDSRSVRLGRLNNGGALLVEHDRHDQVGVVQSANIVNGRGHAVVKFSKSKRAEEVFQDVVDGIRRNVSVGYRVYEAKLDGVSGDTNRYRVTDWEPFEVSITSLPVDDSVGIGRSQTETYKTNRVVFEPPKDMNRSQILLDPKPAEGGGGAPPEPKPESKPDIQAIREEARRSESERTKALTEIGRQYGEPDLALRAIGENRSVEDLQKMILDKRKSGKVSTPSAEIGMSDKERAQFSVLRACQQLATRGRLDGIEKEASEAAAKLLKRDVDERAFIIPEDVAAYGQRAQTAGTATAGGFTVASVQGPMIELLRNKTVIGNAGVTMLTGLTGDVELPKHTGGATAYWVSETGALTDSESTFGQVKLTPHRLGATVPYSTQFLKQTSVSAEAFVRDDLMKVLAIEKDRAALHGSGASGEPVGIQNTTGINATVTFGSTATWADIVEFETGIEADNADVGSMQFVISTATKGKWKTILRDSVAGAGYLIDGTTINGYGYQWTNQVSGNIVFFGVWSQAIMASWSGMEVIVDPYALKKSGQVEITVNELCDFVVRQPLAFNVSTDSGAQ